MDVKTGRILAVDLGNSGAKLALMEGPEVARTWFSDAAAPELPELPRVPVALCSVVGPALPALEAALLRATGGPVLVLGRDVSVPLAVDYATPATLGQDRLAAALAAWREFPDGALVVDAGSALTVDWVDGRGRFRGGAIAPGPRAVLESLRRAAPGLAWGGLDPTREFPGRSSEEACVVGLTGTIRGQLSELLDGARRAAGAALPVLVTGGARGVVLDLAGGAGLLERPHLVFRGIRHAVEEGSRA